jgi:hypothetical protein
MKRFLLLAVFGIVLITTVDAQTPKNDCKLREFKGVTTAEYVRKYPHGTLPPIEFDRPFDGTLTIITAKSLEKVRELCVNTGPFSVLGCAKRRIPIAAPVECTIVIVSDDVLLRRGLTFELVHRHEIGHCNGWPGTHPSARLPNQECD